MAERKNILELALDFKGGNGKFKDQIKEALENPKSCPMAITDINLNLKNRDYAIKEQWYGPMNPSDENPKFWNRLAKLWDITESEAKESRCNNCAAFIQTPHMLACIESNLGFDDDYPQEGQNKKAQNQSATNLQADLGYCQLFGFKCAGDRVCRAWLHGGPVTGEYNGKTKKA